MTYRPNLAYTTRFLKPTTQWVRFILHWYAQVVAFFFFLLLPYFYIGVQYSVAFSCFCFVFLHSTGALSYLRVSSMSHKNLGVIMSIQMNSLHSFWDIIIKLTHWSADLKHAFCTWRYREIWISLGQRTNWLNKVLIYILYLVTKMKAEAGWNGKLKLSFMFIYIKEWTWIMLHWDYNS